MFNAYFRFKNYYYLVCFFGVLSSNTAQADGFRVAYQSAVATGQAMAYAAQADDPSALFYNPAGLTQVHGVQGSFGMSFASAEIDYKNPAGFTSTGDLGGDIAFPAPSNAYLTANLKDLGIDALGPLTIGLGLNSPYGLISRHPESTPFASALTRTKLPMLDIKPTAAYRLADWLSVGLGADIYTFASFIGSGGFEQQGYTAGVGKTQLNADGTLATYNASVLMTPWANQEGKPRLNVGFVYRSGGKLPLDGAYQLNGARLARVRTGLDLPDVYTAALAYWPIRDQQHEWKLEYDMEFVNWSNLHSLDFQFSNGLTTRIPANWGGAQSINVGTEFKWLDPDFMPGWNIAARAGYNRTDSPTPNVNFSPAIPDGLWNMFAIGLGADCHRGGRFFGVFECGQGHGFRPSRLGIDLSFQTYFVEPRKVVSNINPNVIGTYSTMFYLGSLNINMAY